MSEPLGEALLAAKSRSAGDLLRWAFVKFKREVAVASAFGAEGMVLIDIASRVLPDFRLFTLDTEFLFAESSSHTGGARTFVRTGPLEP
jgi:phosphoadenosine phosphosulfate reductase